MFERTLQAKLKPVDAVVSDPYALDRLLSNIRLLHSTYAFIPRFLALPINAHCSVRSFAYKMTEELHHPPIQEIDSELPVAQPMLQLTYKIFGSCPSMQSFDPAKMLTVCIPFCLVGLTFAYNM